MNHDEPISSYYFRNEEFAEKNAALFLRYVEWRVNGYHSVTCLKRSFGSEYDSHNVQSYIDAIECNPFYRNAYVKRMEEMKLSDFWDAKISAHELLSMARNVYAKEAARIAAMKELNVMYSITIVDENGRTKAGKSLDDFYKENSTENGPKIAADTQIRKIGVH
jgi:hypothetical protein